MSGYDAPLQGCTDVAHPGVWVFGGGAARVPRPPCGGAHDTPAAAALASQALAALGAAPAPAVVVSPVITGMGDPRPSRNRREEARETTSSTLRRTGLWVPWCFEARRAASARPWSTRATSAAASGGGGGGGGGGDADGPRSTRQRSRGSSVPSDMRRGKQSRQWGVSEPRECSPAPGRTPSAAGRVAPAISAVRSGAAYGHWNPQAKPIGETRRPSARLRVGSGHLF